MEKFYCNWVEGTSGGIYYRHTTLEAAREEAERLARQPENEGQKVYVMELIGFCIVPETLVEWHGV